MHVFTYGTLMYPQVWRGVAGQAFGTVEGSARGFAIFRVAGAGFPGIVAADENEVRGVVHLDVDDAAVARLDRFEDDFYVRQTLRVECDDGLVRAAAAYVVPLQNRHVLSDEPWVREEFVASGGLEDFIRRFAGFDRVRQGEQP